MEIFGNPSDQQTRAAPILKALTQETMKDGTTGVAGLQIVLMGQGGKDIFSGAHRQLGGVGVIGFAGAGTVNIGEALAIAARQAEAGTFSRSCFKIVEMAGFILESLELAAHELKGFF